MNILAAEKIRKTLVKGEMREEISEVLEVIWRSKIMLQRVSGDAETKRD